VLAETMAAVSPVGQDPDRNASRAAGSCGAVRAPDGRERESDRAAYAVGDHAGRCEIPTTRRAKPLTSTSLRGSVGLWPPPVGFWCTRLEVQTILIDISLRVSARFVSRSGDVHQRAIRRGRKPPPALAV